MPGIVDTTCVAQAVWQPLSGHYTGCVAALGSLDGHCVCREASQQVDDAEQHRAGDNADADNEDTKGPAAASTTGAS